MSRLRLRPEKEDSVKNRPRVFVLGLGALLLLVVAFAIFFYVSPYDDAVAQRFGLFAKDKDIEEDSAPSHDAADQEVSSDPDQ